MDSVQKFLTKFYRGVGTTRGKRLARACELGQWDTLQGESIGDPSNYQSAHAFHKAALVVDIARKLLLPGDNQRRKEAAIATFWECETQNAATNARLSRYIGNQGPFTGASDERVIQFVTEWRKEVKRVLGVAPKAWSLTPRFSGGSTLSDVGKLITIPDKMSSDQTLYERSTDIASDALYGTILAERPRTYPRGNRFFTVPKDSVKDRGCCVEASLNVSLQLAVGKIMKRRYRESYGVDLKHAQYLHRRLSRDASAGVSMLSTIDLSNASDTVCRKLVELILPTDWYVLLNSLRAPTTLIEGKVVWLEKFSSMGNGFTFELETVIFRSLASTCGSSEAYCYGDDMIVQSERAADVLSALRYFGFTPNKKKTFCEGPFRESCGGDFFNGVPVRAHFLKEIPDEPQKWLSLANGLRRVDPELHMLSAAWWYCIDQLPKDWRNFGPSSCGDGVIHVPDALHHARKRTFHHKCGGIKTSMVLLAYKAKAPVSRKYRLEQHWSPKVAMIAGSLGVPPMVSTRDDVIGYKDVYIPVCGVNDTAAGFDTF